jgi:hypothetical protein
VGIKTIFESERYGGNYFYKSDYTITPKEALTAIEVRFLTFDVWGKPIKTLTATDIQDMPSNTNQQFSAKWSVFSENEASEFYASIAYIAQVRTASGRVIQMDNTPVLQEAQKFYKKFTAEDLEPKPDKK